MSIEYYFGTEGATITIESRQDIYDAIDYIHSRCMETFGDNSEEANELCKMLDIVEQFIEEQ